MKRVLFDTNVVLDVLLSREPWRADAEALWRAVEDDKVAGYITGVDLTNIYYLARKLPGGHARALDAIRDCLDTFDICPIDRRVLQAAASMEGTDFEDNVHIACALIERLDVIVTRDVGGYRGLPVMVVSDTSGGAPITLRALTPPELLAELAT